MPSRLSRNQTDELLILAQADVVAAFYNAENGIEDFVPETVLAERGSQGLVLKLSGIWRNRKMSFEVVT